jgi:hypothetical protein
MKKSYLYFFIAAGTAFLQSTNPPGTPWEWTKLVTMALVQGCVAIRALQSQPDAPATNGTAPPTAFQSTVTPPKTP